jgi:uncharacterized transporter YbjL
MRALLIFSTSLLACGSESFQEAPPVNVAGTYSVAITNKSNGCNFDRWQEGSTTQNIELVMTQEGAKARGTVGGLVGGLLEAWLGTKTFDGDVTTNRVNLKAIGKNPQTVAGCTSTTTATLEGVLTGNALQGTITYTYSTNKSPDCGFRDTCATIQDFSGSRPPQ